MSTFLIHYRSAKHSVTEWIPTKLIKRRVFHLNVGCSGSTEVTYYCGDYFWPSIRILANNIRKFMMRILDGDLNWHNQHLDVVRLQELGISSPISVVSPNSYIIDNTKSVSCTESDRHQMNLRKRRVINDKNPDLC